MGQYGYLKCPICHANIQTDRLVERCPACKEYIGDKLSAAGGGTGLNTAIARGEGLKPLGDLEQDVYG